VPKKKLNDNASQTCNTENPLVYSGKKSNNMYAVVTGPEPLCSSNKTTDTNDWPSCWIIERISEFCQKHEWLSVQNKKFGCTVYKSIGSLGVEKHKGMKLSREWVNNEINFFGETRQQQLTSLHTKIFDHKKSSSHKAALKLVAEA
jgi:hypothetical protein